MVLEAAKVLDSLGVGYAVLHGGLSGKDRKAALEQFKTDPDCRVFLSTDAGGTGLNLQVADTVVNLELPWNPAVLEQRIARVHRMGQDRPVRVVNLVTRGTIEERVLRTLEVKQGLFGELFAGDADEIAFEAFGRSGFLDAMRDLVADRPPEPPAPACPPAAPGTPSAGPVWQAAAHVLEAVCHLLAADAARSDPLPAELRERLAKSVRAISAHLGAAGDSVK
jgi:hypothetical protein